jgi:hypothetical protein
MKPRAIILHAASAMKIAMKTSLDFDKDFPKADSSKPGLFEAMANVTQFARMTSNIVQSKSFHLTNLIKGFRKRLSLGRKKSALGASSYELTTFIFNSEHLHAAVFNARDTFFHLNYLPRIKCCCFSNPQVEG